MWALEASESFDLLIDICNVYHLGWMLSLHRFNNPFYLIWTCSDIYLPHDDLIKCHFPCYWPFMLGILWSPVTSPHEGQWCEAFMFSLICAWINGWVNNREAGDLKCHHAHYDVTVMQMTICMDKYIIDVLWCIRVMQSCVIICWYMVVVW